MEAGDSLIPAEADVAAVITTHGQQRTSAVQDDNVLPAASLAEEDEWTPGTLGFEPPLEVLWSVEGPQIRH